MARKWTSVPICDKCWEDHEIRIPVRLKDPDPERCAWCREETQSGIYIRGYVCIEHWT